MVIGERTASVKPKCELLSDAHGGRVDLVQALGMGSFTVEVFTWRGLATYCVLFCLHLETRPVTVAGITRPARSR